MKNVELGRCGGFTYPNCGAAYAFSAVGGVTHETLQYDLDGNLVNDGVLTYQYDAENRLIEVTPIHPKAGHLKLRYWYDYMGRRIRKSVYQCDVPAPGAPGDPSWDSTPMEDVYFYYDGWNVVLEKSINSVYEVRMNKYAWGADLSGLNGAAASGNASSAVHGAGGIGGLLAMETSQTGEVEEVGDYPKLLYFYDGNGNVGQLVTFDEGETTVVPPTSIPGYTLGEIASRYEYDPYGGALVASDDLDIRNPFRFSTKYYDPQPAMAAAGERGLYYYGYRYYSSRMGRWITRDPIGEFGGVALYGFLSNRSQGIVDSLGLKIYAIDGTCGTEVGGQSHGGGDPSNVNEFCHLFDPEGYIYLRGVGTGIADLRDSAEIAIGLGLRERINSLKEEICKDSCSDNPPSQINLIGWSRGAVGVLYVADELAKDGCCCEWKTVGAKQSRYNGIYDDFFTIEEKECCRGISPAINFLALLDPVDMRPGNPPKEPPANVRSTAILVRTLLGGMMGLILPQADISMKDAPWQWSAGFSSRPFSRTAFGRWGTRVFRTGFETDHSGIGVRNPSDPESERAWNKLQECACKAGVKKKEN